MVLFCNQDDEGRITKKQTCSLVMTVGESDGEYDVLNCTRDMLHREGMGTAHISLSKMKESDDTKSLVFFRRVNDENVVESKFNNIDDLLEHIDRRGNPDMLGESYVSMPLFTNDVE